MNQRRKTHIVQKNTYLYQKMMNLSEPKHWPTLNTVIMVEHTIKDMEESVSTIPQIKRATTKKS